MNEPVVRAALVQLRALVLTLEAALEQPAPVPAVEDVVTWRDMRDMGVSPCVWRGAIRSKALKGWREGRAYKARRADAVAWFENVRRRAPTPPAPPRPHVVTADTGDEMDRLVARARENRGAA